MGMSVRLDVPLDEALQRRVAGTEDHLGCHLDPQLRPQRGGDVDLGEDAEPLIGQRGAGSLARDGLRIEPDLGLLLPCNVVVRVDQDGPTLVSALDPELLVSVPGRPELAPIAAEAKTRLQSALATIAATAS
jgi:hypothetical protein